MESMLLESVVGIIIYAGRLWTIARFGCIRELPIDLIGTSK